jgi:hypothetical protein
MIWSASPAGGRAAATGLAALMWALASIFALRGLTLRPIVHNHPPDLLSVAVEQGVVHREGHRRAPGHEASHDRTGQSESDQVQVPNRP